MTAKEFLSELQGYYGQTYNAYQAKYALQWLAKEKEKYYAPLFAELLKCFSMSFKIPPGIKEFEEAIKSVKQNKIPDEYVPLQIEEPMDEEAIEEALKGLKDIVGMCTAKAKI